MKKSQTIYLLVSLLLVSIFIFSSCKTTNTNESNTPSVAESSIVSPEGNSIDSIEKVAVLLASEEIKINGTYYESDTKTGENKTLSGGKLFELKKDFKGVFSEIENLEIVGSEINIGITFSAMVSNEYYKLTDKEEFLAIFEEKENDLTLLSVEVKDKEKSILVEPTTPFDNSLYYSTEGAQLRFSISEADFTEKKEFYIFNESIRFEKLPTTETPYLIIVPLTQDNVSSIAFYPLKEESHIKTSSFSIEPLAKYTLSNGLILQNKPLIEYSQGWQLGLGEADTAANCVIIE